MNTIKLEIPKKSEYISCIRLTASSIASTCNYDVDVIEDIKVIMTEICTFFINNIKSDEKNLLIEIHTTSEYIEFSITDSNEEKLTQNILKNNEIFTLIIDSLVDNYNLELEKNNITFQIKHNK